MYFGHSGPGDQHVPVPDPLQSWLAKETNRRVTIFDGSQGQCGSVNLPDQDLRCGLGLDQSLASQSDQLSIQHVDAVVGGEEFDRSPIMGIASARCRSVGPVEAGPQVRVEIVLKPRIGELRRRLHGGRCRHGAQDCRGRR